MAGLLFFLLRFAHTGYPGNETAPRFHGNELAIRARIFDHPEALQPGMELLGRGLPWVSWTWLGGFASPALVVIPRLGGSLHYFLCFVGGQPLLLVLRPICASDCGFSRLRRQHTDQPDRADSPPVFRSNTYPGVVHAPGRPPGARPGPVGGANSGSDVPPRHIPRRGLLVGRQPS